MGIRVPPVGKCMVWWYDDLGTLFLVLEQNCQILLTKGCSMHIHVAPGINDGLTSSLDMWSLADLRGVLKATGIFDDAIMKIMPADRKSNEWARSNFRTFTNPITKAVKQPASTELKNAFAGVPEHGWKPFFQSIDRAKVKRNFLPELHIAREREVSMNFRPIGSYGTVEFRRPPGVKTAADAQKWAAFAVSFVSASFDPNWDYQAWSTRTRHATVEELQSFISRGLELVEWPRTVLDPRVLVENTSTYQPPEYCHAEEIIRKLAKANKESGFAEKVSALLFLDRSHLTVVLTSASGPLLPKQPREQRPGQPTPLGRQPGLQPCKQPSQHCKQGQSQPTLARVLASRNPTRDPRTGRSTKGKTRNSIRKRIKRKMKNEREDEGKDEGEDERQDERRTRGKTSGTIKGRTSGKIKGRTKGKSLELMYF